MIPNITRQLTAITNTGIKNSLPALLRRTKQEAVTTVTYAMYAVNLASPPIEASRISELPSSDRCFRP